MSETLSAERIEELAAMFAVDRGEFALFGDMRPGELRAMLATIEALQAEVTTLRTALERISIEAPCPDDCEGDCARNWAEEALHGRE